MIEFWSVTKRFPDGTVAVEDLDLIAEDGRITVSRTGRCWTTSRPCHG